MSLRAQAAADARAFLNDADGFAWDITLVQPNGSSAAFKGFSGDIGLTIDPETGQAVTGRRAHVALSILDIEQAGMGLPQAVADKNRKPWVVRFEDIQGRSQTFKVSAAMPDRTLGVVTCALEAYQQE